MEDTFDWVLELDDPDLDQRSILDAAKAALEIRVTREREEARVAKIESEARRQLDYWDAVDRAKALQAERAGAYDSWAPQDIGDLFDTDQQEPTIGGFAEGDMSNGGGVFYAGKVNEIHGPSESGKTMVVLHVAAQEIRDENHVIMVDFEDDGRAIVNRLRYVFGLDRGQIEKYFHYFRPDVAFNEAALRHIEAIDGATMAIIDAVTEGMSIAGLDGRNENEVATWYNSFPKKLAALGMGVVLVDHTPMENASRQIGSQHKKSAVDGVSYTAEPVSPFVKGGRGHLRLRVAKDKIGAVRSAALPGDAGKQYWRGDFRIDGRYEQTRVTLDGVDPHAFDIPAATDTGRARDVRVVKECPSGLQPLLLVLADDGEWFSTRELSKAIGRDDDTKDPALARTYATRLVRLGLAERDARGKSVYFKISEEGKHTANSIVNDQRFSSENTLDDLVRKGPSEQLANSSSEQ